MVYLTCLEEVTSTRLMNDSRFVSEIMQGKKQYHAFTKNGFLVFIFVVILVLSIAGNTLIWLVVPFQRKLTSPMNLLLLNLSLGHIVGSVFLFFFCLIADVGELLESPSGRNSVCALLEGLGMYFIAAGAYLLTLCAISFNRYMAIKYPLRQNLRMTKKNVMVYNFICWICAFAWIFPSMLSFRYDPISGICLRDWKDIHPLTYRIVSLLWSSILPLVFLLFSFCAIVWKRKEDNILNMANYTNIRRLRLQKAEKLLGLLIVTFVFTWTPFFVYWALYTSTDVFVGCSGEFRAVKFMRIALLFSSLNGLIDPLLYTVGSSGIKRCVYTLYARLLCHSLNRITPKPSSIRSTRSTNV